MTSKTNPKGKCLCCKIKIINKGANAIYCIECAEVYAFATQRLNNRKKYIKDKYPDYDFKLTIKITRKNIPVWLL